MPENIRQHDESVFMCNFMALQLMSRQFILNLNTFNLLTGLG